MVGCADMTAMAAECSCGRRFGRVSPFPCAALHAKLPVKRLRTIHRLASANSVQLRCVLGQAAVAHLHMWFSNATAFVVISGFRIVGHGKDGARGKRRATHQEQTARQSQILEFHGRIQACCVSVNQRHSKDPELKVTLNQFNALLGGQALEY